MLGNWKCRLHRIETSPGTPDAYCLPGVCKQWLLQYHSQDYGPITGISLTSNCNSLAFSQTNASYPGDLQSFNYYFIVVSRRFLDPYLQKDHDPYTTARIMVLLQVCQQLTRVIWQIVIVFYSNTLQETCNLLIDVSRRFLDPSSIFQIEVGNPDIIYLAIASVDFLIWSLYPRKSKYLTWNWNCL